MLFYSVGTMLGEMTLICVVNRGVESSAQRAFQVGILISVDSKSLDNI